MTKMKKRNSNKIFFIMILGLAVLFVVVVLPVLIISPVEEKDHLINNRSDWFVYESDDFSFHLEYPPDWSVKRTTSPVPGIHILPSNVDVEDIENITHHTDITNVSVFPHGYPIEGIFSESKYSSDDYFLDRKEETIDFYLTNGETWGTMINLNFTPTGWNSDGFIWSRTSISNHEVLCFDGEEELSKSECDPLMGDTVKHSGSVDLSERLIQEEILRSIKFVD